MMVMMMMTILAMWPMTLDDAETVCQDRQDASTRSCFSLHAARILVSFFTYTRIYHTSKLSGFARVMDKDDE